MRFYHFFRVITQQTTPFNLYDKRAIIMWFNFFFFLILVLQIFNILKHETEFHIDTNDRNKY